MHQLFGWKLTGSLASEAALNEAGADYELIPTEIKEGRVQDPNYGEINPRRQLPAPRLPDGTIMTEGAAILLHIADAFPSAKLIPPPGSPERARHDRLLLFMAVNVYEGELRKLRPERYTDDATGAEAVRTAANSYVERHYKLLEDETKDPYALGDQFCVLDIYIWMLSQWIDQAWMSANCPRVTALAKAVAERPKIAPLHAYHFG